MVNDEKSSLTIVDYGTASKIRYLFFGHYLAFFCYFVKKLSV